MSTPNQPPQRPETDQAAQPAQQPPAGSWGGPKVTPSKALVDATYRLLIGDRRMLVLLLVGSLASMVVLVAIVFPAWFYAGVFPNFSEGGVVGLAVYAAALWASSFVSVVVTGAVVAAALERAEGGAPTVRHALEVAWSRRGPLAGWALLSTGVGVLMSLLERFGAAGLVVRLLAGVGWAVATIFALPLVIGEGTGPFRTLRRSGAMVRDTFGPTLRSNIRLAVPWIVAGWVAATVVCAGVPMFAIGLNDHNVALALVGGMMAAVGGVVGFFTMVTSSALSAYLNTMLYRYATGAPLPAAVNRADLPPLRAATT
jgi:hypothetical protein